jgi:hypothetical protein
MAEANSREGRSRLGLLHAHVAMASRQGVGSALAL